MNEWRLELDNPNGKTICWIIHSKNYCAVPEDSYNWSSRGTCWRCSKKLPSHLHLQQTLLNE